MSWSTIATVVSVLLAGAVIWILGHVIPYLKSVLLLRKAALQFPSKSRHWLWGTLHHVRGGGIDAMLPRMLDMMIKHKRAFAGYTTSLQPRLFLVHSDTIKQVMKTAEPKAIKFRSDYYFLNDWLGDGLLISTGAKWERNRKLLTGAFHFNILQPYVKIYNEAADTLLNKFKTLSKDGEYVEVFNPMALFTLDVMLQCAFSYKANIQEAGESHPYVKAVRSLAALLIERRIRPPLYFDFIFYKSSFGKEFRGHCNFVHTFCEKLIRERKDLLEENPDVLKKRYLDFLDILLTAKDDEGLGLSMEDIRAEADTFLFAGHDTTSSGTTWALYVLAKYPDLQEKVWQEVNDLLRDKEYLEWEDLNKLKYTTLFLKEVLRMYPPVPVVSRQTTKPCVIDGVTIPPGMIVMLSIYAVHHNPEVWENPEEFNPERFTSETFLTRDPYCYVPFSAGPRNCIGQNFAFNEVKVVICRMVKRFRLALDESHEVVPIPELILRPKYGIKLKFVPRS